MSFYTRFRTGKAFLIFMGLLILSWITWNSILPGVPHFDSSDGWPMLNLMLSIESSMFGTIIIISLEKQEAAQREQIMYIRHLLEATVALLEAKQKDGIR